MILRNGKVVLENSIAQKDIKIVEDKIIEISDKINEDSQEIDCTGLIVLSGFIDTHTHGCVGYRYEKASAERIEEMLKFNASVGVTSILPSTSDKTVEELIEEIKFIVQIKDKYHTGAKILGIHLEGPYLSKEKIGANSVNKLELPKISEFNRLLEVAQDNIKLVVVAPELEGAMELTEYLTKKGIAVAMGHTDATYEQTEKAIKCGASVTTHTFNGMRSLNHREPGVIGSALTNDNVTCEMISDFVHLHPAICKLIYKIKGADKINCVSDSVNATGISLSEFTVHGVKRYIKDGVIRLEDGTIAGSAKTLLDAFKNLVSIGIPMQEVSKMLSLNPARTIGVQDKTGSIAVGKSSDLVVLDKNYNVVYTFVNGKCVYKKD